MKSQDLNISLISFLNIILSMEDLTENDVTQLLTNLSAHVHMSKLANDDILVHGREGMLIKATDP